ncbi:MAG: rod shape-determining protein MreC [bacterium]
MRELINFLNRYKVYFTYTFIVVFSLWMIGMNQTNQLGGFRTFVIFSMSQIQRVLPITLNPNSIKYENQSLRELNLKLYSNVVKMKQATSEYDNMRRLADFKDKSNLVMFSSNVVGKSNVEMRQYLTLDRGSSEGVKRGMAVRTDAGLVGNIVGVASNYSLCEVIMNKHSKAAVKIERTGEGGIMSYDGGGTLNIEKISKLLDVQIGDIVLTANISQKYPADIPVGQITEVKEDKSSLFYIIKVKPFVNLSTIEQVFIIKQRPNPQRIKLLEDIERRVQALKR